jgi:hypothetical protein
VFYREIGQRFQRFVDGIPQGVQTVLGESVPRNVGFGVGNDTVEDIRLEFRGRRESFADQTQQLPAFDGRLAEERERKEGAGEESMREGRR